MRSVIRMVVGLFVAGALLLAIACGKVKVPPMPETPNPLPAADADALEVERYQLLEEKRVLAGKYGDNIDRIKQINNRLIEINLELERRGIHR